MVSDGKISSILLVEEGTEGVSLWKDDLEFSLSTWVVEIKSDLTNASICKKKKFNSSYNKPDQQIEDTS